MNAAGAVQDPLKPRRDKPRGLNPAWMRMAAALAARDSSAGALRFAQVARQEGMVPDDIGFYLIAHAADCLAANRLLAEDARRRETEAAATTGGDEGLPDAEAEQDDEERFRKANVEVLQDHGEVDMAALLQAEPADFARRYEVGRRALPGTAGEPDAPEVRGAQGVT